MCLYFTSTLPPPCSLRGCIVRSLEGIEKKSTNINQTRIEWNGTLFSTERELKFCKGGCGRIGRILRGNNNG